MSSETFKLEMTDYEQQMNKDVRTAFTSIVNILITT